MLGRPGVFFPRLGVGFFAVYSAAFLVADLAFMHGSFFMIVEG